MNQIFLSGEWLSTAPHKTERSNYSLRFFSADQKEQHAPPHQLCAQGRTASLRRSRQFTHTQHRHPFFEIFGGLAVPLMPRKLSRPDWANNLVEKLR